MTVSLQPDSRPDLCFVCFVSRFVFALSPVNQAIRAKRRGRAGSSIPEGQSSDEEDEDVAYLSRKLNMARASLCADLAGVWDDVRNT